MKLIEPGEVVDLIWSYSRLVAKGSQLDVNEFARRLCTLIEERTRGGSYFTVPTPRPTPIFMGDSLTHGVPRSTVPSTAVDPRKPLRPGACVEYTLP